ncbi:MAG: hypothetical protein NTZ12_10710 [Candidatus Aminicenantes bacterium]|nr:hypothetical protein [Candidatus Aminicenantes bacterium]
MSSIQAKELLQAKADGLERFMASFDLGLSRQEARLDQVGVGSDKQPLLGWEQLRAIANSENKCFRVLNNQYEEIRGYSESTRRTFSLFATAEAPALLISGHAAAVISIELDPGSLEMARSNPWSQELFNHPGIRLITADCSEEIAKFADGYFDIIIHDPPSISLAGDLYGGAFYRQAWRVLAANGRMFHYLGDPKSALGGRVTKGVVRRLQSAGFRRIIAKPIAHGVLACK